MDKVFYPCLLVASDLEHTDRTVMMEIGALYDYSPSCVGEEAPSRRFVFTLMELTVCSGTQCSLSLLFVCLWACFRRVFEHVTWFCGVSLTAGCCCHLDVLTAWLVVANGRDWSRGVRVCMVRDRRGGAHEDASRSKSVNRLSAGQDFDHVCGKNSSLTAQSDCEKRGFHRGASMKSWY